ncbi:AraC family ligand binding domain-containing protein [Clostridium sp. AM46-21]|uniref:cupin domain-containing protein n=1 Tax=unclassified Clostridium TaxID=2614128 RepID=UPI0026BA1671
MYFELKENKPHGTKDDPFSTYHIENAGQSFQIPVHWHDEFEIIYVKSGFLTVNISGENYIGKPGDASLYHRAICILWVQRPIL